MSTHAATERSLPVESANQPRDPQKKGGGADKDACRHDLGNGQIWLSHRHCCYRLHGLHRHGDVEEEACGYVVGAREYEGGAKIQAACPHKSNLDQQV